MALMTVLSANTKLELQYNRGWGSWIVLLACFLLLYCKAPVFKDTAGANMMHVLKVTEATSYRNKTGLKLKLAT